MKGSLEIERYGVRTRPYSPSSSSPSSLMSSIFTTTVNMAAKTLVSAASPSKSPFAPATHRWRLFDHLRFMVMLMAWVTLWFLRVLMDHFPSLGGHLQYPLQSARLASTVAGSFNFPPLLTYPAVAMSASALALPSSSSSLEMILREDADGPSIRALGRALSHVSAFAYLLAISGEPTITINLGDSENVREIKIGAGLSKIKIRRMVDLLKEYQDVFAWSYADMPGLDREIVEHALPTDPSIPPKKQRLRRTKPELSKKIEEEVMKLLKVGFIEVSHYSDWIANVVPVMKKDGRVRVCIDYRDLNRASPKDDFPLPHIDVLVDSTAGFELFSFMDGFSGYNQIRMKEEDKSKTSFITPWGTFCYKVMPFGLKNAGATYQRAMVTLFHDMMHKEVEVYVDDMIAKSKHGEDHIEVLRKLFDRLRRFKLRLNPAKCMFGAKSRKLLGFMVSSRGIEIDPSKVKAICDLKPPSTVKEIRSLLGRLNYVARFISQLSETAKPFFKLLKKNAKVKWDTDCQEAFEKIKQYLSHSPVLVPPVPRVPLILYLTIHDESLGALLAQKRPSDDKECAVYYLSKKFTSSEINYPGVEKTCAALVWVLHRLRQYTLHHRILLVTENDPIKYLLEKPALVGKLAKWQVLVSEFDVHSMTQKSVKGRAIADMLAENIERSEDHDQSDPIEERISEIVDDKWTMYFDGAVNLAGSGTGAVLISPTGQHHPVAAKLAFPCTNNISEYEACILGLQLAVNMKVRKLQVYGDSALIILQTEGQWRTRDSKLIPYHEFLEELIKEFDEISFEYLPRSQNQFADALATLSSMLQVMEGLDIEPPKIEIPTRPAIVRRSGEYPPGSELTDQKYIRKLASKFFISGNALYKRSFDSILLKCVDAREANQLMKEIHEGECGPHMNGHLLARKIMRLGYFWMAMEADCIRHVRYCHRCQIYADKINVPPNELRQMSEPWPFSMWGIDMIGPINPKASNGHRFILVAIDYFTKWIEANSYANVTAKNVAKFIRRDIIARYGVPEVIITDNGSNLNNKVVDGLLNEFHIRHLNSSPYRPQMNGAVEAANKNIKKILSKTADNYRDWHERLPYALMAYRTSIRTSTGATPFSLVYGMEAVLPVEVEIPSLRILSQAELSEEEWTQQRYDQLNLIDENRLKALCHGQCYQKRVAKPFNRKVRPRHFKTGDLVLRKVLSITPELGGKFAPNYDGPYVVRKVLPGGALILVEMDGQELPKPVNADSVKKYFP
ncbi:uncharacterized protein LOC130138612 [Syzygium oleosum]|uniref:uncharacterized protein LOC130138612 n=1 Tax=Syzygium oleosum TaxID=219896 RepID=UPI0024BAAFCA|nr:uncharacterized protein LOC130138612 [Syzygium oleosum]